MLPTKVLQLDYQDVANMIWTHLDYIIDYQKNNNIKFDLILAKLRNGALAGSILANYFQIPMGVIEMPRKTNPSDFRIFFSSDVEKKLKEGKLINILFVDGICGTGKTLNELKLYVKTHQYADQIRLITYCTLVDSNAKTKPDIIGLEIIDRFIQPPWEWRSFTPQAHLDRLEEGNIKASNEIEFCVGFSSEKVSQLVKESFNEEFEFDWSIVFSGSEKKNITSDIFSVDKLSNRITLEECKTKYKKLVEEKIFFVKQNGLTHFIEDDINQAILISQSCPVCHVIYLEDNNMFKIFAKEIGKDSFNLRL